jgi:hypothetical protein
MNTNIVSLLSLSNTGCTFLDWSILFLSGKTEFYNFVKQQYIPLVDNPVTELNAHAHKKNHLNSVKSNKSAIERFLSLHSGLLTLYPVRIDYEAAAKACGVDLNTVHNVENTKKIINYQAQDFKELWEYLHSINSKIIYIEDDPNLILVQSEPRSIDRKLTSNGATTVAELDHEYQSLFYHNSMQTWKDLSLQNIWDERERRALDIRPFASVLDIITVKLPFDTPHLRLTTSEFWNQGEMTIRRVFNYCQLDIDSTRWEDWKIIYNKWKGTLNDRISFCYRLPTILNATINGWYYNIGELTFIQEVIIQHCLIYKYNLNLKTWQLTKFPTNTQDLHKLLEPNIHPIPKIY